MMDAFDVSGSGKHLDGLRKEPVCLCTVLLLILNLIQAHFEGRFESGMNFFAINQLLRKSKSRPAGLSHMFITFEFLIVPEIENSCHIYGVIPVTKVAGSINIMISGHGHFGEHAPHHRR